MRTVISYNVTFPMSNNQVFLRLSDSQASQGKCATNVQTCQKLFQRLATAHVIVTVSSDVKLPLVPEQHFQATSGCMHEPKYPNSLLFELYYQCQSEPKQSAARALLCLCRCRRGCLTHSTCILSRPSARPIPQERASRSWDCPLSEQAQSLPLALLTGFSIRLGTAKASGPTAFGHHTRPSTELRRVDSTYKKRDP